MEVCMREDVFYIGSFFVVELRWGRCRCRCRRRRRRRLSNGLGWRGREWNAAKDDLPDWLQMKNGWPEIVDDVQAGCSWLHWALSFSFKAWRPNWCCYTATLCYEEDGCSLTMVWNNNCSSHFFNSVTFTFYLHILHYHGFFLSSSCVSSQHGEAHQIVE